MPIPNLEPLAYEGKAYASLQQARKKINKNSVISPFTMSVTGANLYDYVVDAQGDKDFRSIQNAIDNAVREQVDDGQVKTIFVLPGAYPGNITLYSNIHLIGSSAYSTLVEGTVTIEGNTGSVTIKNMAFAGTSASAGLLTLEPPTVGMEVTLFDCAFFPTNSRGLFIDAPAGMTNVIQSYNGFLQTTGTGVGLETRENCEINWFGGFIFTNDAACFVGGTSEQRYYNAFIQERLSTADTGRVVSVGSSISSTAEILNITTAGSSAFFSQNIIQSVGANWAIGLGTLQTPGDNVNLSGPSTVAGTLTVTSLATS